MMFCVTPSLTIHLLALTSHPQVLATGPHNGLCSSFSVSHGFLYDPEPAFGTLGRTSDLSVSYAGLESFIPILEPNILYYSGFSRETEQTGYKCMRGNLLRELAHDYGS
jgi:hypothetical protein